MASLKFGIPGIGGSLGACAVCGDTFMREILLRESVPTIGMDGFDRDLPVHAKCRDAVMACNGPWKEVRDRFPEGPMKQCFDEQQAELSD